MLLILSVRMTCVLMSLLVPFIPLRKPQQLVALTALSTPRVEAVGVATASVDLGNEWLKVGLVKVRT